MPFDPNAYLKQKQGAPAPNAGFDPDRYLSAKAKPQEPSFMDKAQATAEGFGQGILGQHLPQVEAAVQGLLPRGGDSVDEELRGRGFTIDQPEDSYVARRDANIARMKKQSEELPGYYYGGQIGGMVASAPIAGAGLGALGLAGKGAGLLSTIGKGAAGGALMGAIQNPGDVEGQVDQLQLGERLKGAGTGALIGGATTGAAQALTGAARTVKSVPDFLKGFAEKRAAAATGLSKGEARKLIKLDTSGKEGDRIREIGRFATDNKLVQVGDDIEDVARKASQYRDNVGKQIGDSYRAAQEAISDPTALEQLAPGAREKIVNTAFRPQQMADEYLKGLQAATKGKSGGRQAMKAVEAEIENLLDNPEIMGIEDMHKFQSGLDDVIYANDRSPGSLKATSKALKTFRDFIDKRIDDHLEAVDSAFGKSLGDDLRALNKQYSMSSKIRNIARDRLAGDLGNNFLSLTDKLAFGGGAAVGAAPGIASGDLEKAAKGAALGAGVGLLSKGARTYGRPLVAGGADKLGGLLNRVPESVSGGLMRPVEALESLPPGLLGAGSAGLLQGSQFKKKGQK